MFLSLTTVKISNKDFNWKKKERNVWRYKHNVTIIDTSNKFMDKADTKRLCIIDA